MIKKILLTRPAGFNDEIAAALQARKVQVVQAPLVRIQGLNLAMAQLPPDGYLDPEQYIIFTSQTKILFQGRSCCQSTALQIVNQLGTYIFVTAVNA